MAATRSCRGRRVQPARAVSLGFAAASLLAPAVAVALGLGELQVESRLNQPLEARIPLVSASDEELGQVQVTLADTAVFERAGIVRSQLLRALRFEVVRDAGGAYVRVRSAESVREPALEFVVDVSWPGGHVLREYSLLLTAP